MCFSLNAKSSSKRSKKTHFHHAWAVSRALNGPETPVSGLTECQNVVVLERFKQLYDKMLPAMSHGSRNGGHVHFYAILKYVLIGYVMVLD